MKDETKLIIDKIEDLKEFHGVRLDSIDVNLKEHMRRTDVLESLHKDNQVRISSLEKPAEARKYIVTAAKSITAVAAAILIIAKLLGKI